MSWSTCVDCCVYLADGGQFGEKHLEDRWRQRLLQNLQQLLRLTAHSNGVGQVVHTFLIVSCGTKKNDVKKWVHRNHAYQTKS